MSKVESYITSIPDFPEPGVVFRDITTVIGDPDGLQLAVDEMSAELAGLEFDVIAGLESRGFLFGMPIAYKLHKAFIPIRKKGKLPRETVSASYDLEYGSATIEVHKDDIKPGMRVVLVDDLIATGGTIEAAARLLTVWVPRLSRWSACLSSRGCTAATASRAVRCRRSSPMKGSKRSAAARNLRAFQQKKRG